MKYLKYVIKLLIQGKYKSDVNITKLLPLDKVI
jgi:hypothetical protein